MSPSRTPSHAETVITAVKVDIDLRDVRGATTQSNTDKDLTQAIIEKFTAVSTPFQDHRLERMGQPAPVTMIRSIPTMVLYSDKGLDIFDKITYSEDYYVPLFNAADEC